MTTRGSGGLVEQLEELLAGGGGGAWAQQPLCGRLVLERVRGRTTTTSSFACYPLKFMLPSKVSSAGADAVWAYMVTYGGGIVSGDRVAMSVELGEGCTGVLTTQGSTKIYHSSGGRAAEQHTQMMLGPGSLLALLPDPVTCFRAARYRQQQVCHLAAGASLVLVDWLTSGRMERDEAWVFDSYESWNLIYSGDGSPLLLDKICLEQGAGLALADKMQGLHVYATIVAIGPRTVSVRKALVAGAANAMRLNLPTQGRHRAGITPVASTAANPGKALSTSRPRGRQRLYASCSPLGEEGVIVRVAGATTEEVYDFLRGQLAPLTAQLGAAPYASIC